MSPRPLALPQGFRFGVATAGFQVEGGYNGSGEPRNNWYEWERAGRVEPSGIALDFWNRYEDQLDRAVEAGCDAFRLSVEWARCEPVNGELDDGAFDRYAAILRACRERGMEPLVTLHHFTHPGWLGVDFWRRSDAPERFARWARTAVGRLGAHCRQWVTINEPNSYAINSNFTGIFPPGRLFNLPATMRVLDHMLAGHILAYGEIHAQQSDAVVSTNNFCLSIYQLDRLLGDVLLARRYGVQRRDVADWLGARKVAWERDHPRASMLERLLRRIVNTALPLDRMLSRTVDALFSSPHECSLDVTQIDYYNPIVSNHVRLPGHRSAHSRNWLPSRLMWDDTPCPEGLLAYMRLGHEPGLELWITENGLCNPVRGERAYPRIDGWNRERYLKANLAAVVQAIDAGLPVGSYYHWTLADNYEWGSYEPRFGLYQIERKDGVVGWGALDSMGGDAAGAYRRIIKGLRSGDRSVLDPPIQDHLSGD